jgi:hypothetical protein
VHGVRSGDASQLFEILKKAGAANRIRTCDPVITNDVLYQLSYCGGPMAAFGNKVKTHAPDIGHGPVLQEKRWRARGARLFLRRFL